MRVGYVLKCLINRLYTSARLHGCQDPENRRRRRRLLSSHLLVFRVRICGSQSDSGPPHAKQKADLIDESSENGCMTQKTHKSTAFQSQSDHQQPAISLCLWSPVASTAPIVPLPRYFDRLLWTSLLRGA